MRTSHICPKCKHNRILIIAAVPDWRDSEEPGRLNIATVENNRFQLWSTTTSSGDVSSAVCRRCGYAEFYVVDPASIRIDGKNVIEAVGPDTRAPYR